VPVADRNADLCAGQRLARSPGHDLAANLSQGRPRWLPGGCLGRAAIDDRRDSVGRDCPDCIVFGSSVDGKSARPDATIERKKQKSRQKRSRRH
jgi:hypothetical protein